MAITALDYRLTLRYVHGTGLQPIINTFYYQANNANATASDLNDAFVDKIIPKIEDCISVLSLFDQIETVNLADPTDFDIRTSGGMNGNRSGEFCSLYQCWAFRLNRSRTDRRNGRKSFGVPADADIVDGVANADVGNDILVKLGALETALGELLFFGGGLSGYLLSIPHSVKVVDAEHPNGHYVLNELNPMSSVQYIRVSTQNSRKSW